VAGFVDPTSKKEIPMQITPQHILDALRAGPAVAVTHTGDRLALVGVAHGQALVRRPASPGDVIPLTNIAYLDAGEAS